MPPNTPFNGLATVNVCMDEAMLPHQTHDSCGSWAARSPTGVLSGSDDP